MHVGVVEPKVASRAVAVLARLAVSLLSGAIAIPCGEIAAKLMTGWEPATEIYFVYEIVASVLIFGPLAWLASKEKKSWWLMLGGFAIYTAALLAVKFLWLHDGEQSAFQFVPAYVLGAVVSVVLAARSLGLLVEKFSAKSLPTPSPFQGEGWGEDR